MARRSTNGKCNIKSTYQLRKEKYKFEVGNMVIHLGSLYEEYKLKIAKVLSRSERKATNYYLIEFEDGKQMEVKESWIKGLNLESENVEEIEEGEKNENNQTIL